MKRSLIWTAAGAAVLAVGVPAYAAVQAGKPQPSITTVNTTVEDVSGNCDEAEHASDPNCFTIVVPASQPTTLATQPTISVDDSTDNSIDDSTNNSIDDDNATENSVDDSTDNSIDDSTDNSVDDATENSVDDATSNSVDDISGPCDEAEHANDPRCTGTQVTVNSVDDNSDSGRGSDDSDDSDDDNGGSGHGSDD